MAPPGRPTPQPDAPERPRFTDRKPEDYRNPRANPYVRGHFEYGPPVLPATEAASYRGRWEACFGREAPLHLEIGSGNGFFLTELARRHPEWNVLGIEIRYKRVVQTAKKLQHAEVEAHARIARYHAAYLDDLFEPGALAGLYVNHPDPWPKERHEKNRLISRWFLEDVVRYVQPGGVFQLKSDHRPNVDRVEELLDRGPEGEPRPPLPLTILGRSDDVMGEGAPWDDDIQTNYQRKMHRRGKSIHAIALRVDGPLPEGVPGPLER